MKFRRSARYRLEEVRVLVEEYQTLREKRGTGTQGGLRTICVLADLDRALRAMPLSKTEQRKSLLMHGQLGLTIRASAEVLGQRKSTVEDRYSAGLTWLTNYLNGENT